MSIRHLSPTLMKEFNLKEADKIITLLVVKLESVFTSPDINYINQEDEANVNPNLTRDDPLE